MKIRMFSLIAVLSAAFITQVAAHLDRSSLSIKGGETFTAGDTVTVTWKIAIPHHVPLLIYYSSAPESGWEKIDSMSEPSGSNDVSYRWKVPMEKTQHARFRVFQRVGANPGSKTDDYTLVSDEFTISAPVTSAIFPHRGSGWMMPGGGNAEKTAVDLKGRLVNATPAVLNQQQLHHGRLYLGIMR